MLSLTHGLFFSFFLSLLPSFPSLSLFFCHLPSNRLPFCFVTPLPLPSLLLFSLLLSLCVFHFFASPLCLSLSFPFPGVTWGKVVSLYAVAGALAVDCVRHGHPAIVHTIVDCMGEFVRKSLVSWLKRRGGWVRSRDSPSPS